MPLTLPDWDAVPRMFVPDTFMRCCNCKEYLPPGEDPHKHPGIEGINSMTGKSYYNPGACDKCLGCCTEGRDDENP